MLTIFTIPKPFDDRHTNIIQCNAVRSWLAIRPRCEIILCGNDTGVAQVANEFDVGHIPNIAHNDYGTPLLNSAFEQVQEQAKYDLLCYVNADIILFSDLARTFEQLPFSRFLVVGQRWNLSVVDPVNFDDGKWEQQLRDRAFMEATKSGPIGSDYFGFRKGSIGKLPPFVVGRPAWDNWFIFHVRRLRYPVIDTTQAIMCIHQNHEYAHVPQGKGYLWEGPEADRNRSFLGMGEWFDLWDATHIMDANYNVDRAISDPYLARRIDRMLSYARSNKNSTYIVKYFVGRCLRALYSRRAYFPERLWRNLIYYCTV